MCLDDFPRPDPQPREGLKSEEYFRKSASPSMEHEEWSRGSSWETLFYNFSELVYLEPEECYMGDDFPQAGGLVGWLSTHPSGEH